MFNDYMTQIIGGVAIIILIIAYIIIKKSSSKNKKIQTLKMHDSPLKPVEAVKKSDIIEDAFDTTDTDIIDDHFDTQSQEDEFVLQENLSGKEEGSFESPTQPKTVTTEATTEATTETKPQTITKKRPKKDVPPHGKIVKDDFKMFEGARVLVAEDNLINQKVIGGLLADTGVEIVLADDGQIALDILQQDSNFDIILMDAHMPRVDGFEATRLIRQNPDYDHILVVALSGDTASDDIKKMQDAGMEEQLEKPLRMDALYDIFYAYIDNSKESDEEYIEVLVTKELDGNKGLEICGGDEEFYNEILDEFIQTYTNSSNNLAKLLQAKQFKEADKLLLDIVGITANIGADNLNNLAQKLKVSIQNPQDRKYLNILKDYHQHLVQLLKDIKKYR